MTNQAKTEMREMAGSAGFLENQRRRFRHVLRQEECGCLILGG